MAPQSATTPSAAELIRRAEAIVPLLVEQQAETEARGCYSPQIHDALREAGLYRVLHPRRFGGFELDFDCFFRIVMQIARGCPSSGWMFCLGAHHGVTVASVFPPHAQEEMLGGGHFVAPSASEYAGRARRAPADDGWIMRGTYRYCSAMPYATYFMGHAVIDVGDGRPDHELDPMFFALPADQVRVLDDSWGDTLGFRGTGSYTVAIEDAFVPDHLALPGVTELSFDPADGSAGLELHGNPMYCGPIHSSYMLQMAAVATGIAMGALDEYDRLLATKSAPYLPIARSDDPDYRRWYGRAVGQVTTCQLAIRGWAQRWHEIAGPANANAYEDLRLGTAANEVIELAWDAVQGILFRTAGPSSLAPGSRMERAYRDFSMLRTHSGLSSGAVAAHDGIARRRFGKPWIPGPWTPDYPRRANERVLEP